MSDNRKFPGDHTFEEWSKLELYADSIVEKVGIIDAPGTVADFKRLMATMCDVIDGQCVAKETGKPMMEHALTDWRKLNPHFWHMKAPPDLAHDAIVKGDITQLGRLHSAIGKAALEAECVKKGTTLADLLRGKLGTDDNVVTPKPKQNANPWSAASWNLSKQKQMVSALGIAKCQSIAASADPPSFVGATHAGAKRLIPRGE